MTPDDPNYEAWLAAVRQNQTPENIELEQQLRAWLADGTLPTLKRWHGRPREQYALSNGGTGGGDCEVTAFALYRDLRRAKLDADWTLVCGEFGSIGRHYWNVYQEGGFDGGNEPQAVNVNLGRVLALPLGMYLQANECVALYRARPGDVGKLYASATRMGDGRSVSFDEMLALDALNAEAFNMPPRWVQDSDGQYVLSAPEGMPFFGT